MSSEPRSQAAQPSSVQASQITGGRRGSTPWPATGQSSRSSTAQDGTASDNPISRASPTTGEALNARNPPRPSVIVVSIAVEWFGWDAAWANSHGMIDSSRVVLNTTGLGDVGPRGGDLALVADQHGLRLRGGQPEGHVPVGGRGRAELDPDQFEELDVVEVGDPVEAVDQLVDHLGHRLDQRHAGVGDVVVGPASGSAAGPAAWRRRRDLGSAGRRGWVRAACQEFPPGRTGRSGWAENADRAGAGSPAGSAPVGSSLLGMT